MLLNVLKVLNQNENYFVKVVEEYNNIGREVKDNFNLFERNEIATPTPFRLIGHDSRLNISVENKIYGKVKLNPIQAKKVGLDKIIDGPMTYNTKTIIRDGKLNVNKIQCIVCYRTYFQLKKMNVNMTELENTTSYPGKLINIDLSGLTITPKIDFSLDDIYGNVNMINELKAKQKVLNALKAKNIDEGQMESIFTPDQIELLKEHGLNENLVYVGVDNEIKEAKETYEADIINFKIKKSACSSFKGMLQRIKDNKSLNALDTIQYNYYVDIQNKSLNLDDEEKNDFILNKLSKIKSQLRSLRLENTLMKIELYKSQVLNAAINASHKDLVIEIKKQQFEK